MLSLTLITLLASCTVKPIKVAGALPNQRAILADAPSEYRRDLDTLGLGEIYGASVDQLYAALPPVYRELGLEPNEEDKGAGRVGVRLARCMGRVGKTSLSSYLDCGQGITGPNADMYRVTLNVVSTVTSKSGGQANVATLVFAEAVDMSGSASDRVGCTSTGRLEAEIAKRLRAKLVP